MLVQGHVWAVQTSSVGQSLMALCVAFAEGGDCIKGLCSLSFIQFQSLRSQQTIRLENCNNVLISSFQP